MLNPVHVNFKQLTSTRDSSKRVIQNNSFSKYSKQSNFPKQQTGITNKKNRAWKRNAAFRGKNRSSTAIYRRVTELAGGNCIANRSRGEGNAFVSPLRAFRWKEVYCLMEKAFEGKYFNQAAPETCGPQRAYVNLAACRKSHVIGSFRPCYFI